MGRFTCSSFLQYYLVHYRCLHSGLRGHSLNMSSISHWGLLGCLLPPLVVSLALAPQDPGGSLTLTNPSSLPPFLNDSHQNAGPIAECDPVAYGLVEIDSCKDAFDQIPHDWSTLTDQRLLSYGPRDHGTWDAILPKRYISCEPLLISRDWRWIWLRAADAG